MIEIFIVPFLLFVGLVALLVPLIRKLPVPSQAIAFTIVCTLLLTPSWGPATIVAVPVPFGALLAIGVFGGALHELPALVALFWKWHIVAFPVTAAICYLIGSKILETRDNGATVP